MSTAQEAARTLDGVKKDLAARMAAPAEKMNAKTAARAAEATEALRTSVTEWYTFYNGYDPMFMWWMGVPYKQVDKSLQDYAAFLRDKSSDPGIPASPTSVAPVQPVPALKYASVPDLNEIVALPQDEMRDIVTRFNGQGTQAGRGGGRGGGRGARCQPTRPRPRRRRLRRATIARGSPP